MAAIGAILVILSFILRFAVADRVFLLNYNFYLPVALLLPTGILFAALAKAPVYARALTGLMILGLSVFAFVQDQPNILRSPSASDSSNTVSLMSYNVMAYSVNEEGVRETIRESDPDVLCIIEGTFGSWAPQSLVRELGEDYSWALGNRLSIASRLPIIEESEPVRNEEFTVLRVVVETPTGPVAIHALDMDPPLRRQDRPAFDDLRECLEGETHPSIMLGDFNAPRSSVHLARAVEGWQDAFESPGADRYLGTWPSFPAPLWQIDHAFYTGPIEITKATIPESLASDHLPILLEFRRWDTEP